MNSGAGFAEGRRELIVLNLAGDGELELACAQLSILSHVRAADGDLVERFEPEQPANAAASEAGLVVGVQRLERVHVVRREPDAVVLHEEARDWLQRRTAGPAGSNSNSSCPLRSIVTRRRPGPSHRRSGRRSPGAR